MNAKSALDSIVARIAAIHVHLSGDDSPLANPWEEIKEQLQTELSGDWEAYLITIKQIISGFVFELTPATLIELSSSLRCSSSDEVEQKLLKRIIQRGKREKVNYLPFDFSYFCYPLLDFTVYAKVIERTGWQSCVVTAYSSAAPYGERGEVSTDRIEYILTKEAFEKARERGWPERWEDKDQPAQTQAKQLSLFEIPAAAAAKVSEDDFDALMDQVLAERAADAKAGSIDQPPLPEGKKPAPAVAGTGTMEQPLNENGDPVGQAHPAGERPVDIKIAPAGYGESNTIFTKSAAERARERLRKKLGTMNNEDGNPVE